MRYHGALHIIVECVRWSGLGVNHAPKILGSRMEELKMRVGIGEKIRRSIRERIGYRSWLYRSGSRVLDLYGVARHGGLAGLRLISVSRTSKRPLKQLRLRSLAHPIYVRSGTPDGSMIIGNVLRGEYGQFPISFTPATILDAGAYIGDCTAYFASLFPDASVLALEPEPENARIAQMNLDPYGQRVRLKTAALWSEDKTVCFDGSLAGGSVRSTGGSVQAVTIESAMEDMGWDHLDLLKLDIEGAELDVLSSGAGSWLNLVTCIVVEIHGHEIEAEVLPILRNSGFSCSQFRSIWYCIRSHE